MIRKNPEKHYLDPNSITFEMSRWLNKNSVPPEAYVDAAVHFLNPKETNEKLKKNLLQEVKKLVVLLNFCWTDSRLLTSKLNNTPKVGSITEMLGEFDLYTESELSSYLITLLTVYEVVFLVLLESLNEDLDIYLLYGDRNPQYKTEKIHNFLETFVEQLETVELSFQDSSQIDFRGKDHFRNIAEAYEELLQAFLEFKLICQETTNITGELTVHHTRIMNILLLLLKNIATTVDFSFSFGKIEQSSLLPSQRSSLVFNFVNSENKLIPKSPVIDLLTGRFVAFSDLQEQDVSYYFIAAMFDEGAMEDLASHIETFLMNAFITEGRVEMYFGSLTLRYAPVSRKVYATGTLPHEMRVFFPNVIFMSDGE